MFGEGGGSEMEGRVRKEPEELRHHGVPRAGRGRRG